MVRRSFLILLGVCLIFGRAQASSVTQLQFQQQEQTQTWTLDQLKKALKLATLTEDSPFKSPGCLRAPRFLGRLERVLG